MNHFSFRVGHGASRRLRWSNPIYLFVYLSAYLFVHLSVYLSAYLFVRLFVYLFADAHSNYTESAFLQSACPPLCSSSLPWLLLQPANMWMMPAEHTWLSDLFPSYHEVKEALGQQIQTWLRVTATKFLAAFPSHSIQDPEVFVAVRISALHPIMVARLTFSSAAAQLVWLPLR